MAKSSTQTYRTNAKSRAKHVRAHSKQYKREHSAARKRLGIKKGSKQDASKQPDGSYKRESLKINRGRGGGQRK